MKTWLVVVLVWVSFAGQDIARAQNKSPEKMWKDATEHQLYLAAVRQSSSPADAGGMLQSLIEWKLLYPATDFELERLQLFVRAYTALDEKPEAFEAVRQLVNQFDNNLGLYWACVLTPQLANPPEDAAGLTERAATELLDRLDAIYMDQKRPADLDPAKWHEQKTQTAQIARAALEWSRQEPRYTGIRPVGLPPLIPLAWRDISKASVKAAHGAKMIHGGTVDQLRQRPILGAAGIITQHSPVLDARGQRL